DAEDEVGVIPLICKIRDSFSLSLHAWYLDDVVVGEVLELIIEDGPRHGLHLNIDKTKVFWLKEDPRSKLAGVFPPNISRTLHDVKLLSGPDSVDFDFSSELVMKRVAKSIKLMDVVGKINDAYYDVLNYAFLSFKLQSASLQTKLLQYADIVTSRPSFDNALCTFNARMEIDLLSTPSEIVTPKLMKKLADIYFTHVTQMAASTFSLTDYEWVFTGDIYGDHVVSCSGIIGIKHRHNVVHDTIHDIYFLSGISASKEVNIRLGSSPLTQTGIVDFVSGRVVIEAAQRKCVKCEAKCADIGYGFIPFSFFSFGELEKDAVSLLKRIRKFSVT
ncbi:hypothetical protein Tco_1444939, partial [Tanacetum coccineum]